MCGGFIPTIEYKHIEHKRSHPMLRYGNRVVCALDNCDFGKKKLVLITDYYKAAFDAAVKDAKV